MYCAPAVTARNPCTTRAVAHLDISITREVTSQSGERSPWVRFGLVSDHVFQEPRPAPRGAGLIAPLRSVPPGQGVHLIQPLFA